MYLDIAAFLRYNFRAFFKSKGTQYRLTPKRFLFLFFWNIGYVLVELINRIFFLLDEIFFPGYHKQEIRQPVFIIGNPRSGTTFLHRLMFKDKDSFTAFTVWELVLAPSITQRKIIWGIGKIGKAVGHPVSLAAKAINKSLREGKAHVAHTVKVEEAEEDEHVMIHAWSSETLFNLYPFMDEVFPYFYFDRDIPEKKQCKVMRFYKRMIQKHLYAHGGNKILLSKNPSHSSRINALSQTFPDAQFIKLIRNPFEALPSMLDSMSIGINIFCDPLERYPFTEEYIELMKYYYFYPVEYFKDKPDACKFIKYDDLVEHPDEIVEDLYSWLKLDYSGKYEGIVSEEAHAQRQYKSQHVYPLEQMGLTEERIISEFADVFSFYEFDQHEFELPEREMNWQTMSWNKIWKRQRQQRRAGCPINPLEEKTPAS
ncbi:MAG: sulfotransferase [Anaerolineaceae bacterium]